jgi:hypothetical protein
MKVRATERMPPDDFIAHLNHRHAQRGELADLTHLSERAARSEKDRYTWEAYHRRLHDVREYPHEHGL